MGAHTRRTYISPRDLLRREAALCEYAASYLEPFESCLAVMKLNYPTSLLPFSKWALLSVSLRHQMVEQSQSLFSMAMCDTNRTLGTPMNYSRATATCLALLGGKSES